MVTMPLILTSQEKKVLAFVAVMVALGGVMLGLKQWGGFDSKASRPKTSSSPVAVNPTP